jgi:F-type H+-transporting ATPase subunit alpha
MEEQVVVLYAGMNGFLDTVPVGDVVAFEQALLALMRTVHDNVLATIRKDKKVDDPIKAKLNTIIQDCLESFLVKKA